MIDMPEINVVCSNIIEKDGRFLFVKESKDIAKDRFSLPAGRLEFGESLVEGAIREAKEETGLDIKPVNLIGIYQRPLSSEDSNTTIFCFHSIIESGAIEESEKHPEIRFLSLDEIRKLEEQHLLRSRYMYPAINDYLDKKGIDISFLNIIR